MIEDKCLDLIFNRNFGKEFFTEFLCNLKLNWQELSIIYREYVDYIDWWVLYDRQKLSRNMIREFQDRILVDKC